MAGSTGCRARSTEAEPTTDNRTADDAGDAGEQVCVDHETASTPFVLALRAPGAVY
jgi:hypothetical protein